jgi:DNA-binding NtrC family response regulator
MSFQANLLHVLDRREIRAVGSHAFHEVKARFIVATNRDISALTSDGRFLPDLEFRISGLRVDVPPLRERIADFDLLLALALRELRMREGVSTSISIEARNFLTTYRWPGNIRELFNAVLASGLLAKNGNPISLTEVHRVFQDPRRQDHVRKTKIRGDLATRMEELEKEQLLMTLRLEGGSQTRAAAKLGITRRGLNKKLHRFGLLNEIGEEGLKDFSYRKRDLESAPKKPANDDTFD